MSLAGRITEWLPFLWFLLALMALLALWMSGALDRLAERVTRFGGFGLSFEFTEKSARETRESVEQALGSIRVAIKRRLANDVRAAGLQEALASLVESVPVLDKKKGYRVAIHIPDPLYLNQLYQLLDYHPKGGGAGRTFSTRTGIIGMAWRNLEPDTWHQDSGIDQRDLMRKWGMTRTEAQRREAADSKKLFLAFPLYDKVRVPIGVLYFEAESREAMGLGSLPDNATTAQKRQARAEADDFLEQVRQQIEDAFDLMSDRLADLVSAAKKEGPQLQLEGQ